MVIDFYARCNNIDTPTASRIIREFLEEMRRVLETKKSIVFPGLGKLRATKENYFFFVADEDLDIYPEGFGLEPISLKTHEETPAEVSAGIEEAAPAEANIEEVEINVNEPATEEVNAPAEPTGDNATLSGDNPVNVNDLAANAETAENTEPEPAEVPMTDNKSGATVPATTTTSTATNATTVQATSQKPAGSKTWQVIKWTVIILVILAVTALLTFIILAHIAPDFIDTILYTPEELEILNL